MSLPPIRGLGCTFHNKTGRPLLAAIVARAQAAQADKDADFARSQYERHVRAAANWRAAELATREHANTLRQHEPREIE